MKVFLILLISSLTFGAEEHNTPPPPSKGVERSVLVKKNGRPVNSQPLSCEQKVILESQKEVLKGIQMAKNNSKMNERGNGTEDRLVQLLGMCAGVSRALGAANVSISAQNNDTDGSKVLDQSAMSKLIFDTASLHSTEEEIQDICFEARLAAQFKGNQKRFNARMGFQRMQKILSNLQSSFSKDVKATTSLEAGFDL